MRAFSGLGRTEEAAKHREEYVKLKSQELAQTERSRVELRERDLADPRPLASDCYVNAGKLYAAHAAPQQTESLWAKAYALNPENPQLRKLLELLHGQRGPARVGAADFAGDRVGGPGK